MSLDRPSLTSFQSLRRIVLGVLTLFILSKLIFSLIGTLDRPQIQGKFELYQTNLVLVASQWQPTEDAAGLGALQTAIVGADLLESATQQYQDARESDVSAIEKLNLSLAGLATTDADPNRKAEAKLQASSIERTIAAARAEIAKIDLRIGILQAVNNQPEQAIKTWQKIDPAASSSTVKRVTASLIEIWKQPSNIDKNTLPQLKAEVITNFDGWFRDRVLQQLYTDLDDKPALAQLSLAEQVRSKNALIQLALITIPRIVIALAGVGLIVFFTIRFVIGLFQNRSELSLTDRLLANIQTPWATPWNWEIVWQVFVLGFFFVGQFLLPVVFSILVNPATLTARGQGLYVFSSYVLMSVLATGVLYASIKSYLPVAPDWFRFDWKSNWWLWGIGGYLVATPIVIVVSLINDKIWQGQGGSNPLLQIVLEIRLRYSYSLSLPRSQHRYLKNSYFGDFSCLP
jgi:uncharacterized protein